jgi:phosphoribosylanthranilate isomerase
MSTFVKICGMTDEVAVRAAVDAGADAVGFVFYEKSPRNLSLDQALRLSREVPEHVARIAVTLHPDEALWADIQATLRPDALQTDAGDFDYLAVDERIEKWPVIREGSVPRRMPAQFVYEGKASGQGQTVDWQLASSYAERGRMILAGGLSVDNVAEAISIVHPFGVDVSSAVESRPGVKDPRRIKDFVQASKAALRDTGSNA